MTKFNIKTNWNQMLRESLNEIKCFRDEIEKHISIKKMI
jgi:hypothetical protein